MMNDLKALENAIFKKRPLLQEVLAKWDSVSLYEYAQTFSKPLKAVPGSIKNEFIAAITEEVSFLWGNKEAEGIRKDLENNYTVSTADHHGPLTHPFFVHSNLLAGSVNMETKNIITLSCSNVSLNNSSYPRGFLVHDLNERLKINLFRDSEKHFPVYSCRPINKEDIARASKIKNKRIESFIKDLLDRPEVINKKRWGEQVSVINNILWEKMFGGSLKSSLRYLELEKIASELISKHHINTPTIINKIIFDPETRKIFTSNFNNPTGILKDDTGTTLFWYLPKDSGLRVALSLADNALVSHDKKYKISLEQGTIKELLDSKEIIPNTIFSLLILSAYYGVKCLGGFSQIAYLTEAQKKYNELFMNGASDTAEHTQTLCADLSIGFLDHNNTWTSATGVDLCMHTKPHSWNNFINAAKTLTLREAVYPIFPDLYTILYSPSERNPKLAEITASDIIIELNLKSKVRAVAWIENETN